MIRTTRVNLKVENMNSNESYMGFVKIPKHVFNELNIKEGNNVIIEGNRKISANAFCLEDGNNGIIKMDNLQRLNADTNVNETVKVSVGNIEDAKSMTIVPVRRGVVIHLEAEYIKKIINNRV